MFGGQLLGVAVAAVRLLFEDGGHRIELAVQALDVVGRAGEPHFGVLQLCGERRARGPGDDSGRAGNHAQRGL